MNSLYLLLLVIALNFIFSYVFSFVGDVSLKLLLSSVANIAILMALLNKYKGNFTAKLKFTAKGINGGILLLGGLIVMGIHFLPVPDYGFFTGDEKEDMSNIVKNETNLSFFIYSCLLIPIYEEVIFRGLIMGGLLKKYGVYSSILISSFLFGILHFQVINALIMSLFLGIVYLKTSNLLYSILLHSFANLVIFCLKIMILMELVQISSISELFDTYQLRFIALLLLSIGIFLYLLNLIFKKIPIKEFSIYED